MQGLLNLYHDDGMWASAIISGSSYDYLNTFARYPWLLYVQRFLLMMAQINLALAVFNILPIPPLDGSKVVAVLLPDRLYVQLMRYERYGIILLLLLSWLGLTGNLIGNAIMGVYGFLLNLFFLGVTIGKSRIQTGKSRPLPLRGGDAGL